MCIPVYITFKFFRCIWEWITRLSETLRSRIIGFTGSIENWEANWESDRTPNLTGCMKSVANTIHLILPWIKLMSLQRPHIWHQVYNGQWRLSSLLYYAFCTYQEKILNTVIYIHENCRRSDSHCTLTILYRAKRGIVELLKCVISLRPGEIKVAYERRLKQKTLWHCIPKHSRLEL